MPKIALALVLVVATLLADAPGSALSTGMVLEYAVGDSARLPYKVISVTDTMIGGIEACRSMVIKTGGSEWYDRRSWCASGDMFLEWDSVSHALRPVRPVGEGMSLEARGNPGERLRYDTRSLLDQTVDGRHFQVIETVTITRDSAGRQSQRRREFFAPALALPTSGVIEAPDSTRPGSWRIQSAYKLVRITP
ncbi:MAG TPA: hypothetical protein VF483_07850 [Gemmatimonadaceae bacterium]